MIKNIKYILLTIVTTLLLVAVPVTANDNLYVGLAVGPSSVDNNYIDDGMGWKIFAGMAIDENIVLRGDIRHLVKWILLGREI